MRSGSPAHDDHGWPSPQHPYRDEAGGPARYGPGSGGDPHQAHDAPFGPEISWPQGFRPLDTESRELLESAYGGPDLGHDPGPGPAPRRPAEGPGRGGGFAYQQPAMDDYGYGDPGYSDPSYDGPRNTRTGPQPSFPPGPKGPAFPDGAAFPGGSSFTGSTASPGSRWYSGGSASRPPETAAPGYHVPEAGGPAFGHRRPDSELPAPGHSGPAGFSGSSGSGDVYPVTGAQEALPDTGPQPPARPGTGYPDEWYGHPRLDDRALDDVAGPRAADPRLEGMRYDELRYDEPDRPEYDEPLDDVSWFKELRRGGPAFPSGTGGEPRRVDPSAPAPGHGHQPGYPQRDRGFGGAGPAPQLNPRAGAASWPGAQPDTRLGPRMQADGDQRPFQQDAQGIEAGFLGAPVGVLNPPAGTPVDDEAFLAGPSAAPFLAPTGAGRPAASAPPAPVRPGHGLDGPEITSSWPVQPASPSSEDLAFDEFWHEDDGEGNGEYSRLFGDEAEPDDKDSRPAKRRTGRRRGRSNDHRLWLALGGVVAVTAAAVVGVLKFELPSHGGGPVHAMATPANIGNYQRKPGLERQTDLAALRAQVIKMSSGQASRVVSAVYESGDSTAGGSVQMVMFIGGHLANAGPAASISGFTQQFPGAKVVSAGPQGGKAACVEEQAGSADSKSICVWFDNDSFGTLVSPTMNASALSDAMRSIRPSVELTVKE